MRRVLLQFILLYAALFSAFGSSSPFLPAFLAGRGLGAEELGLVLGSASAVRLLCGPIAGRVADRTHLFRAELAVGAILAAGTTLLYLLGGGFWAVMGISLLQAAALAPLCRSPTPSHSLMLEDLNMAQDLSMDGCAASARLRLLPAQFWPGKRQPSTVCQRSSG